MKYRYNNNSYFEILEIKVNPIFEKFNLKYKFIQNNASIYCTYKI